jgi:hypothetical protein
VRRAGRAADRCGVLRAALRPHAAFPTPCRRTFSFEDPYTGDFIAFIIDDGGTGANTLSGGTGAVVEATQNGLPLAGNGYLDCNTDGTGDTNLFGHGD